MILAYRPFIDPLPIAGVPDGLWYLTLPPLVLAIAIVYKAVRMWHMHRYWREVVKSATVILTALLALAATASLLALLNTP